MTFAVTSLICAKIMRTNKMHNDLNARTLAYLSYVVEETREPGVNHRPLMGDHFPAMCTYPGHSNLGTSYVL